MYKRNGTVRETDEQTEGSQNRVMPLHLRWEHNKCHAFLHFFSARRVMLCKCGIQCVCYAVLFVCLSVCHSHDLCRKGSTDRNGFLKEATLYCCKVHGSPANEGISCYSYSKPWTIVFSFFFVTPQQR